jgi:renalase
MKDVIVIGAGVAGLTVARDLKQAGREVLVLEKSRGLAGRSATRTINNSKADHGAQYFTVRDERFQKQVNGWLQQEHLKIWSHGFHRLTEKGLEAPSAGNPRYVFPKGMNTVGKLLGQGLDIRTETKVTQVEPRGEIWRVSSETGETFEAKTVILNMPPEQASALCTFDIGSLRQQLESVVMEPSFALMAGYEASLAPGWQGLHVDIPSPLSWISHDSSKRSHPTETVLVMHSTPAFARDHFEADLETVQTNMLNAVAQTSYTAFSSPSTSSGQVLLSAFNEPTWTDIQRWKYALASKFLDVNFLQHDDSLYFCGDWCGGARLEAAFLSGLAVAQHLAKAEN